MPHHEIAHRTSDRPTAWWAVPAWVALGLLVACGLAGAAGLG